jgi:hypothetical protein
MAEGNPSNLLTQSFNAVLGKAEASEDFNEETTLCWGRPTIEGSGPCARGGHTAVLAGTYLVIFGGHYYGGSGSNFLCTLSFYLIFVRHFCLLE